VEKKLSCVLGKHEWEKKGRYLKFVGINIIVGLYQRDGIRLKIIFLMVGYKKLNHENWNNKDVNRPCNYCNNELNL